MSNSPMTTSITESCLKIQRLKFLLGVPMSIKPASQAFQAGLLTTTPQHPSTKNTIFVSSNPPWQRILQHMLLLL